MANDWTIVDLSDKIDFNKIEMDAAADHFRACMAILEPGREFPIAFKEREGDMGNRYIATVPVTWTSPKPHCAVQITCDRGGIDLEIFCSRRELVEKILRLIKEDAQKEDERT
jgi:hypothetical protein